MIAVVSDLHFSDGSTSTNVSSSAYSEYLFKSIQQKAISKSVKEIKIVLLGDIFDLARTIHWQRNVPRLDRPWNGELDPTTAMNSKNSIIEGHYQTILKNILQTEECKRFFNEIGMLSSLELPLQVIYVIGNHDRAFYNFESLKQILIDALPTGVTLEFRSEYLEPNYKVLCRHGHEWDDVCYGFEFGKKVLKENYTNRFDARINCVQTIGEVVTSEIMSGLIFECSKYPSIDQATMKLLTQVNNVRPMTLILEWLTWINRGNLSSTVKTDIINAAKRAVENFLNTELAKKWDQMNTSLLIFNRDFIDTIELLLDAIKNSSFNQILQITKIIDDIKEKYDRIAREGDKFEQGARSEFIANPDLQYVIYGHTHAAKSTVFSTQTDGSIQCYLNTGTYLPVIMKAKDRGFSSMKQMTMTFIYRADEDLKNKSENQVSVDFWRGERIKECI